MLGSMKLSIQLIIIPLPHHHLLRLIMAEINNAKVAINSNLVAHLERMTVELAELIVDIHFEAVAADHTDLAETHCRDCRM